MKHVGSWRVTIVRALQDKNWQFDLIVNSRLIPLARLNHQNALFCKKMIFHISHVPYFKYHYIHKMLRASRENFERETLEKTKINSSIVLNIWFSKSYTLTLSIDISLRDSLVKSLSHYTQISRRYFGAK